MSAKDWTIVPCGAQGCHCTSFYVKRERRTGTVRVVCHGCGATLIESRPEAA